MPLSDLAQQQPAPQGLMPTNAPASQYGLASQQSAMAPGAAAGPSAPAGQQGLVSQGAPQARTATQVTQPAPMQAPTGRGLVQLLPTNSSGQSVSSYTGEPTYSNTPNSAPASSPSAPSSAQPTATFAPKQSTTQTGGPTFLYPNGNGGWYPANVPLPVTGAFGASIDTGSHYAGQVGAQTGNQKWSQVYDPNYADYQNFGNIAQQYGAQAQVPLNDPRVQAAIAAQNAHASGMSGAQSNALDALNAAATGGGVAGGAMQRGISQLYDAQAAANASQQPGLTALQGVQGPDAATQAGISRINSARIGGGFGGQASQSALGLLGNAAQGNGPTAADIQGQKSISDAMRAQLTAAASARGGAYAQAAAQEQAAGQAAQIQVQGAGQAAALRAQEQQAAQAQYAQAAGQAYGTQGQLAVQGASAASQAYQNQLAAAGQLAGAGNAAAQTQLAGANDIAQAAGQQYGTATTAAANLASAANQQYESQTGALQGATAAATGQQNAAMQYYEGQQNFYNNESQFAGNLAATQVSNDLGLAGTQLTTQTQQNIANQQQTGQYIGAGVAAAGSLIAALAASTGGAEAAAKGARDAGASPETAARIGARVGQGIGQERGLRTPATDRSDAAAAARQARKPAQGMTEDEARAHIASARAALQAERARPRTAMEQLRARYPGAVAARTPTPAPALSAMEQLRARYAIPASARYEPAAPAAYQAGSAMARLAQKYGMA